MNRIQRTLAVITVMLAIVISGCSGDNGAGEKQDSDGLTESRGEHDRDGAEHGRGILGPGKKHQTEEYQDTL